MTAHRPSTIDPTPGPVRLTASSRVAWRPATGGAITTGFWAERRRVNRETSVPQAWDRLHEAGNFHNLELAAGRAEGAYVNDLPFLDSDVYKWLEAVGWTFADPELPSDVRDELTERLTWTLDLLTAAQEPDGYLDSCFQVRTPGQRFADLRWGHELYCAGHLIQAGIAVHRTTGDTRLLAIGRQFADLVVARFGPGPGQLDGVCGHPEIETALVELARETGETAYAQTARHFVDRRGAGTLGTDRFGRHYWQDHLPVREAPAAAGHAVRQLYLLAGVADVHAETGDDTLLDAAERLWSEMVATKTYLTGGVGAHHLDEAFGDPYELPNERSYCETCAAIASVMFSWRMLLATGAAKYADLLERTLYNAFLAGLSLDGQSYIYANPLQVRDGHLSTGHDGDYRRVPWFHCACCPPNVMRLLASLEHYVLVAGEDEVRLHQYVSGVFSADLDPGSVRLRVETDYPWDGRITVAVDQTPSRPWGLTLRVPHWASAPALTVNGEPVAAAARDGWLTVRRDWTVGDEIVLDLPLAVRLTRSDPRVDVNRGAVALERGPLVYCLEAVDHPGPRLDDLLLDPTAAVSEQRSAELGGVVTVTTSGTLRSRPLDSWWPYAEGPPRVPAGGDPIPVVAVPYFAWGNRGEGAMRVWVPTAEPTAQTTAV